MDKLDILIPIVLSGAGTVFINLNIGLLCGIGYCLTYIIINESIKLERLKK